MCVMSAGHVEVAGVGAVWWWIIVIFFGVNCRRNLCVSSFIPSVFSRIASKKMAYNQLGDV